MLILTRRKGETLVINETIVVQVISSSFGRCRLGILAPKEVGVLRGELLMVQDKEPTNDQRATH